MLVALLQQNTKTELKMASVLVNHRQFTIDEGFEEVSDESIRVYGSIREISPQSQKSYAAEQSEDNVRVWVQDPQQRLKLPADDAASRDSDSLMRGGDTSENEFDPSQPCWNHPKIRSNWKIVLAATALLVVGIGLLIIGVVLTVTTSFAQGVIFFLAGIICFIPGVYHVVYIYLAVKGRRGYYFYHLPLFN